MMPRQQLRKCSMISELSAELNAAGFQFSSANSINIGRLVPQIVYYVYAYSKTCWKWQQLKPVKRSM